MSTHSENLLGRAWSDVVDGYEQYFVPRFRPWLDDAIAAIDTHDGDVVIPCCGPGHEVERLARRWPTRRVVAVDLSPGMIDRTRQRCAALDNVEVICADATALPAGSYTTSPPPRPRELLRAVPARRGVHVRDRGHI